jgi:hypothetical protein
MAVARSVRQVSLAAGVMSYERIGGSFGGSGSRRRVRLRNAVAEAEGGGLV